MQLKGNYCCRDRSEEKEEVDNHRSNIVIVPLDDGTGTPLEI